MYFESFPSKLKKSRLDNGFETQSEVAEILKTSQTAIARYETGTRQPNIEMLGKLCDLYNVSADWLISTKFQKK